NSPSRGAAVYSPAPIFLERGAGTRVWDADGNEYTDFMMSFGALISWACASQAGRGRLAGDGGGLAFCLSDFGRSGSGRALPAHGAVRRGCTLHQYWKRSHNARVAFGARPY